MPLTAAPRRPCAHTSAARALPGCRCAGGAHLALAHGHAGAVPVALLRLGRLVVVVAAGAQRRAQLVLVLRQALDHDSGHRQVHAEVGAGPGAAGGGGGRQGAVAGGSRTMAIAMLPARRQCRRLPKSPDGSAGPPPQPGAGRQAARGERRRAAAAAGGRPPPHLWAYCSENLRITSRLRSSAGTSVAAGGRAEWAPA